MLGADEDQNGACSLHRVPVEKAKLSRTAGAHGIGRSGVSRAHIGVRGSVMTVTGESFCDGTSWILEIYRLVGEGPCFKSIGGYLLQ